MILSLVGIIAKMGRMDLGGDAGVVGIFLKKCGSEARSGCNRAAIGIRR
jgi:hypothetical protein